MSSDIILLINFKRQCILAHNCGNDISKFVSGIRGLKIIKSWHCQFPKKPHEGVALSPLDARKVIAQVYKVNKNCIITIIFYTEINKI
jgi:hypothetical protein